MRDVFAHLVYPVTASLYLQNSSVDFIWEQTCDAVWNQLKLKLLVQYKVKRQIDRLPLFSSRFLFSSWFLPSTLWVVPKYPLCDTTYPLRSTKFSRGTNHVRSVFSSLVTILICTSTNLSKLVLLLHNTAPDEVPPLPQVLSPGFGIWFLGNSIWSILLSHT